MASQKTTNPTETAADRRKRLAWEAKAIEKGRAAIEQDGTIPLDEVEAWVESWDSATALPMPQPRK